MAMNAGSAASGTGLAGEIKTLALSMNPQLSTEIAAGANMDWLFDAVAQAVVTHLITNMTIATRVDPASNIGTSTAIS